MLSLDLTIDLTFPLYITLKTMHLLAGMVWVFFLFYAMDILQRQNDLAYARRNFAVSSLALVISVVSGLVLLFNLGTFAEGWIHAKILCVCLLVLVHVIVHNKMPRMHDDGDQDVFFQPLLKSAPFVLCVAIVGFVLIQPF